MKWFSLLFVGSVAAFAQPATVTVADQFYRAVGGPTYCTGTITLSWSTFYSTDGFLIQGGTSAPITVNSTGNFSVSVVPTNTTTTPASGIYTARYNLQPTNCAPASDAWNVGAGPGPYNLSQVRTLPTPPPSLIPPASIAPPTSGPSTQALCWSGGNVGWGTCGGGTGGGTVTDITVGGLSPIFTSNVATPTTTPAVTFTLSNAGVGQALIGPSSGSPAPPTYRALVGSDLPDPGPTSLGGIQSMVSIAHRWIDGISTLGVPITAQPAFTDISGALGCGQLPAFTGDVTNSSCAMTVVQIEGGAIPTSEPAIGTNSGGQPIASTSTGLITLWTSCSGTKYLGADGACHTAGTGTVTSIATTSPLAGGTITGSGTLSCPTCVTSATSLDSGRLITGAGSQGVQNGDLSGDAVTSGSTAVTVTGVNGAAVPSSDAVLGTNSSGQLVAATAASIVSLFSSCAGTEYLGADGSCHSAGGTGTVTSIATTSPIGGGTITTSGTITCTTCVTGSSLTSGQLIAGGGSQAVAVTNLSGDATTSGSAVVTVGKVDGVSYPSGPSADTVPVVTSASAGGTVTYEAVPNAALAFSSITITPGTGLGQSGCNPVALGGTCTLTPSTNSLIRTIGAGFDGSGSALTSGSTKTVYFTVPFACTIAAWNITVDTGTITFDVWKIATGTAIPTVSNSIVASAAPAISTGTAVHSTTLTGWTTSVSANDIFGININTVASATKASLTLQCSSS